MAVRQHTKEGRLELNRFRNQDKRLVQRFGYGNAAGQIGNPDIMGY
jgi:hypothetical protein